jgi:O-antigen ligase/polysaccharide polymerase Wzy-like membrane protein
MLAGPQAPAAPADRQAAPAGSRRLEPAALLLLAMLTIVWSWWAAKDGAFFETVLLPGTILLCATAVVLAWTAPWRGGLRTSRPTTIALSSLAGLGVWAALSALWSPAPDVAVGDGQRILTYALAFGLGIWLCNLLGGRLHLALVPLAAAGAFAGIVAVFGLLTGDHVGRYLDDDGTLEFPLGYRNANAAFFAIALWPALGLASHRASAWPLRAAALATATLCLELAMLSQSRGSLAGGAAALCVYLFFSDDRARRLGWLALAVVPALLILPALIDLYRAANADAPLGSALGELRGAGRAVTLTCAGSLAIGAAAALLGRRVPASPRRVEIANRAALAGLVAVVLAGSIAFVVAVGNPVDWIDKRVSQLGGGREPNLKGQSNRFTDLNAETQRPEIWRVALLDAREHPLLGEGGGGFLHSYLREREQDSPVSARDAHSVELENLSELGVPGLLLFAGAIGAAGLGAMRARRRGPQPAWLSIIALTAGAYWLVHASLDWFWPYPAITAPVLALLGSACAPALRIVGDAPWGNGRRWLTAGAVVLAISAVPPYLSHRYVNDAYDEWPTNPSRAYEDLDRARTWNPLSADPVLAEGAIARANGDRTRAIDAFRQAAEERPEEWAAHYNLAELHARSSPRLARLELAVAKRQNPYDPEVLALEERFAEQRGGRH